MRVLLSTILFSKFAHTLAGFVFTPAQEPSSTSNSLPADLKQRAQAMASELQESLPGGMAPPKQFEPAIDQPKEEGKAKETRSELLAAASLFNAASSGDDEEQQAVEDELREAMASPSQVGKPDRDIQENSPRACLPDFTQCPVGWNKKGALCIAADTYTGDCTAEADLSEMNIEQKMAWSNICSAAFPCQEDCAQDFRQICPSLWREIATGICSAPLNYEGDCEARLDVTSMTEEDKFTWGVRCGARWPCAAPMRHNYEDVCPNGWSLQFGKMCSAPTSYDGPCEHTAYMGAATAADKKTFEATCHVEWPASASGCTHDFSAPCPFGWYHDGEECLAPVGYTICSNRKSFKGLTPADKEDWAQNCRAQFPCQG